MHHSSMPHQALFVVRIAGLPVSCLQHLTFRRTAPLLTQLLARDTHLQQATARLSDALHTQVAQAPDGDSRRLLLGLRRALFNRQGTKVRQACERLHHLLPAPLAAALTDWQAQVCGWDDDMAQGEVLLAADWQEQRANLRVLMQDATLQQGLLLASPELTSDLRAWLRTDAAVAPGRKLELSMLLYLTRMAAKTSPYSTFTAVAAGRWHPADSPAVRQSTDRWARQSRVEANRWVVNQIIGAVLAWPDVRPAAVVLPNTSLHISDATLHLLTWKRGEAVVRMRATPAIAHLLKQCAAPHPPTYRDLVAMLAAQVEDDQRERVPGFLDQVIDSGLLSLAVPVAEQHPHYLAACAEWLERCATAPSARTIAHALQALDAALRTYEATESVAERTTVLATMRATLHAISATCAARGTPISLPDKNLLYEESLIPHLKVEWSLPRWQHVLADLQQVQRLLRLFDPFLLAQMQIAETFVAQFGRGATVPLLTAYTALRDSEIATHWQGGGMDAAVSAIGVAAGTNAPIVQQLQQRLVAWLAEQPGHAHTIALDRDVIQAMLDAAPPALLSAIPMAFYSQIIPDDHAPLLVINAVQRGTGRSLGRLLRLHAQPPTTPAPVDSPVYADLAGVFTSTISLRAPCHAYEITYPAYVSQRPPEDQLPIDDLLLHHDPATDRLQLRSRRLGNVVVPVHQSMLGDVWLPPLYRFLLRACSEGPTDPVPIRLSALLPAPDPTAVAFVPRLMLGDVVIDRAHWRVHPGHIPARQPHEPMFGYLVRLQQWRRAHGIPDQCFVRSLAAGKYRKPIYLDFGNPLTIAMLERALARAEGVFVFQELLPRLEHAWVCNGAERLVSEVVIDVPVGQGAQP